MPIVQIPEGLIGRDAELAAAVINPHSGRLRATKPTDGEAAYVWRMVAFDLCDWKPHSCLPVTAVYDLPAEYWGPERPRGWHTDPAWDADSHYAAVREAAERRRERIKQLDAVASAIADTVPKHLHRRWHQPGQRVADAMPPNGADPSR